MTLSLQQGLYCCKTSATGGLPISYACPYKRLRNTHRSIGLILKHGACALLSKSAAQCMPKRLRAQRFDWRARSQLSDSYKQIDLTLRRPLGITLAENAEEKNVFVESIAQGGNAENSGKVMVGDIVIKVSATVLKAGKENQYEKEGYGQRPYDNWEKIMFDCEGQDFGTVMSAIDSNNPRWGINDVTLVLKRKA